MAASWMKAKMLKVKRDGMRDSRGPFERFSDSPSKHIARAGRASGWYVVGADKRGSFGTYRGAPRSIGPFATQAEARRSGRAMFHGDTFKTFEV